MKKSIESLDDGGWGWGVCVCGGGVTARCGCEVKDLAAF